jgi:hypothetical protein
MTEGWETMVGGDLEFEPDWNKMLERSLELIDAKRAALKLPAYDPTQFGDSGDSPYFAAIRAYLAEHDAVETVGSPAYALGDDAHGHSHADGDAHDHSHGGEA